MLQLNNKPKTVWQSSAFLLQNLYLATIKSQAMKHLIYTAALLLTADGTLWGTGFNYAGELGIGSTTDHLSVLTKIARI